MYDIAVCDDDRVFADTFQQQLTRALETRGITGRITSFSDPDALRQAIEGGAQFDLLFLDVLFDTAQRGISLASALRDAGCRADVVFMSSAPEFAVDSFDAAPLHYLVKPVPEEKLHAALDRFLDKNTPALLRLDTYRGYLQIPLAEVTFFEIFAREIVIHKTDGQKETCVGTLKGLEKRLPAHMFVCPHRSYLVNLAHISEIVRYQIRISTGERIPVSQKLYMRVQQALIDYADRRTVKL